MKTIKIYSIANGYKSATVWEGSRMTQARVAQVSCTPDKGLTREQRHAVISSWLYNEFLIPGPAYRERDEQ